jgi:predicted TIM-barrel fold metal-dependent hydrolase
VKIDVFCHIMPPKYLAALEKRISAGAAKELPNRNLPVLSDLELRFKVMDQYEDIIQVLTVVNPPVEEVAEPKDAVELARIANDEMAELVAKYPKRFIGAVACLPYNDMDATLKEIDRTIKQLNFKGIQIFTHVQGKPLDSPEFYPIWEKMVQYDLPIWLHPFFPHVGAVAKDSEQFASYRVFTGKEDRAWAMERAVFGLPGFSASAMTRLVWGQIFEKFPKIKIITHHCGSTIPYLYGRIDMHYTMFKAREGHDQGVTRNPVDYYKMFYADTALHGNTCGLMCGYEFFGGERILFGTDAPFDGELGSWSTRKTIESIEAMNIPAAEKKRIFEGNAKKLLKIK